MADTALINSERTGRPEPDSDAALFHRRIEFHAARKPFSGFSNNSSDGFKLVTLNPGPESQNVSQSGKGFERLEPQESGLDPELSFSITFRRIGAGLRNLGNTCFLNSVLQCLTYTEPLAAYLQSGKHQNSCRTAGFCALCAIQKHVSRALQSTGRILEPKDLVSNLRCISRNFRNARQEDAHEYMVNLLESMHKCCLPSGIPSESPGAYEKSLVHRIFGGRLRSQVKCMQCSFCSNKFDPFLDLSLEIVKADSLHRALCNFTAKEQLDGGAKQYQCQKCKQKVKALKQLTVHKAPHVLTVHLKRFGSHVPGQKIDKKVAFGPTLDLKPFVTGPHDGDLSYTLYGVLVHAGWSTHSGHYYCFVRTSSGMWYSLDDNQVVQVNERRVLEQKAYMLFYVRDRRNIFTKKPVDGIHNENMVMSAMANVAYSKFNLELKENFQNGSVEKKLDGSISVPLSERDTVIATAPKETPLKNISLQNMSSPMSICTLDLKKDPGSEQSVVPSANGAMKNHPSTRVNDQKYKAKSCSTVESSHEAFISGQPAKMDSFLDVKDLNAHAAILPTGNLPQDSPIKKQASDSVDMPSSCHKDSSNKGPRESADQPLDESAPCTSPGNICNMDGASSGKFDSKSLPVVMLAEASNKINHIKPTEENSIAETGENKQRVKCFQSSLLSVQQATAEHLPGAIAKNKRPQLKVKRKLFKCQIATTSLSSNVIFGGALSVQKKKHKKRKRHSRGNKSTGLKHSLSGHDLPYNVEPSVSGKLLPVTTVESGSSQKKKSDCGSDDKDQTLSIHTVGVSDCKSTDVISNELKRRVVDCTTLSAEKQPQTGQSSEQGSVGSEHQQIEARQSGLMSMLTRGLEETTVARWDGIDVSLSKKSEARSAGPARIGYIGDDWDEEYDRGKRKKIRSSKLNFGGPNLFQELATRNLKRKMHRPSFQHPFRI